MSKVNRFSCGIGKSTVDDGSLVDSWFTAEAFSCGMLCVEGQIWGTDRPIASSGYIDSCVWICECADNIGVFFEKLEHSNQFASCHQKRSICDSLIETL